MKTLTSVAARSPQDPAPHQGSPLAATLSVWLLVGGLAGCGQKGPLTLPAAPAASSSASAPVR